jgi:hypothetical protein
MEERRKEKGAKEKGGRSKEQGARNKEEGTRNKEQGARRLWISSLFLERSDPFSLSTAFLFP